MASESSSATSGPAVLRTEKLSEDGGVTKDVFVEGSGEFPKSGDEIIAHYTGRLLDGSIFDSSVERGQTFKFTLGQGQVIKAWDLGFASARKGEKFTLTAAPSYAYGASGSPPKIPANATLRFECELIGFGPKKKQSWEMTSKEKVEEAERCKGEGNRCFTGGDLLGALDEYKAGWRAIEYLNEESVASYDALDEASLALLKSLRVTLHSNSAMVHLKLGNFAEATKECTTALKYEPANAKALFRRGTARAGLGLVEEAKADLLAAAKVSPSDAGIRAELDRVKKLAAEAAQREKKAFGGIFNRKGFSLEQEHQQGKAAETAATPAAAAAGAEAEAAAAPAPMTA